MPQLQLHRTTLIHPQELHSRESELQRDRLRSLINFRKRAGARARAFGAPLYIQIIIASITHHPYCMQYCMHTTVGK